MGISLYLVRGGVGKKSRHNVYVGSFFVVDEMGGGKKSRHRVYDGNFFLIGERRVVGRNPDTRCTLGVSL